MLHRVQPLRMTHLSIALLTMLFSNSALAGISIHYNGGNHSYGVKIVGHGIKYYGYRGYNYGYNKHYNKRYPRYRYRNNYYNKYYRPRSYSNHSLGHSSSSTYSPAAKYYSNKKYSNDPWNSLANGRSQKALYTFTSDVQKYLSRSPKSRVCYRHCIFRRSG